MRTVGLCAPLLWAIGCSLTGSAFAQSDSPMLERIRIRVAERLAKLPNFTCLETVERSTRAKGGRAQLLDTIRLEVALVDGQEMFAWPGAQKFEHKDLRELVSGTISNGQFAMLAQSVFLTGAATFTFKGEELADRRPVNRFEYVVPVALSGYRLRSAGQEAIVGYHGGFITDAATSDLVSLEVIADDIPPSLEISKAATAMNYQEVRLGEANYLLPLSSGLMLTDMVGREHRNHMEFNRCKQYLGESVIRFGDAPESTVGASEPTPLEEISLPEGVSFTVRLDQDIETRSAAIGDPVRGVVDRDVKKKDGKVIIPRGATVLGRISRLELSSPEVTVLGVQLLRVEFQNHWATLAARLDRLESANPALCLDGGDYFWRVAAEPRKELAAANTGILFWRGDRPKVMRGLRTNWRTEAPKKEDLQ
jgi:hypothetical protein